MKSVALFSPTGVLLLAALIQSQAAPAQTQSQGNNARVFAARFPTASAP